MDTPTAFAREMLQRLAWSSLQACLLIAAVALLLRLVRVSAAARSALWWLVGLQLLLGLAWSRPLALPLLAPAVPEVVTIAPAPAARPLPRAMDRLPQATARSVAPAPRADGIGRTTPAWPWLVLLAWLAGLAWQLPRLVRQWRQARAVHAGAEPVTDPALRTRCQRQARALGLRRCPELRQCAAIASPQVGGWWRPVVLLPTSQELDAAEWEMAVAHELAHLARRDLWLGVVPALAQRLFFFHPAVRWAMREYALHREAACDARVMRDHHPSVQAYGRLLLRLGVSHPLHAGLAGASPTFDNLKRRLLMLQQSVNESTPRSRGWLLVALVAMAGVLPYRVTAGDGTAKLPAARSATPTANTTPAARPMPAASAEAVHAARYLPPPPPPLPPAPPAPLLPLPPPPPPPPHEQLGFHATHSHVSIDRDARDGLALFDHDDAIFSGSDHDLAQARRLHRDGKPMLWFRQGDKAYLVRDAATIQSAKAIYQPVTEMARAQGELAGRQGELAGQQAGLAAEEAAYAQQQAQLAGQQAELAGQAAQANADPDVAVQIREARQRALEQQQATIEASRAAIEKRTATQRQALQAQQAQLEQQQQSLAQRQQQAGQQVEQQMRRLLDEAVRNGKAQAVNAD